MKAAAYIYADGGPISREIILSNHIAKYGVRAVMGRDTLGAGEIRRMNAADNIVRAYHARMSSDDWAKWAEGNAGLNRILNEAMLLAEEDG